MTGHRRAPRPRPPRAHVDGVSAVVSDWPEFEILIGDSPDRERVLAEIWRGDGLWAEVINEHDG